MLHEVIVVGSGPAGLTAGIYLGRFKRNPLIIDGDQPGGQLMTTSAVENWPGEISIEGPELMKKMREQAEGCGATFLGDSVEHIDFAKRPFVLRTKRGKDLLTKSIIIATGSKPKKLGCPGEEEFWGKGVNVCATCDAPLYKNKEVVVVGGGNSAVAEAFALSKHAKKVTVIQVLDRLTATDPLKDTLLEQPNVDILLNQKVVEIVGENDHVTGVVLEDQKDKSHKKFSTDGVFIAIGMMPSSNILQVDFGAKSIDLDERGYIVIHDDVKTSLEGIFAAGDISDSKYRQAITASGMGCAAALECEKFLRNS